MARNPQDINPEDVFPRRSLPDEAEPWGRTVEDRLIALEKAVLGQSGSVQGINRNIAATTASLSDQLLQIRTNYPIGAIIMYSSTTAPFGWLVCDGSAVSRTDYADLFALIGTTYGGGDGSTTFNLPNLKGRVAVGLDTAQSEFNSLGETGGAKTHTLTVTEMPSHNHSFSGSHTHNHTQNAHSHTMNIVGGGGGASPGFATGAVGFSALTQSTVATNNPATVTISGTTGGAGGGQAHNNLQPYIALPYIIKYTVS